LFVKHCHHELAGSWICKNVNLLITYASQAFLSMSCWICCLMKWLSNCLDQISIYFKLEQVFSAVLTYFFHWRLNLFSDCYQFLFLSGSFQYYLRI
jgi:hypothetical protein